MSLCPRPLDPIDAEAVASGAEPLFAPDAAEHTAGCPSCGEAVERARGLARALEGLSRALPTGADLAGRVTRLRAFSRRERRTYALWRAPISLTATVGAAGLVLLCLPALSASEQAGLGAAALAPTISFFRALLRWAPELSRIAPTGLEALSDALQQERGLGWAALALLVPSVLGFRRVLARARSRR